MMPAALTVVQLLLDGIAAKRGFTHIACERSVMKPGDRVFYSARGHVNSVVFSSSGASLQEALDGLESAPGHDATGAPARQERADKLLALDQAGLLSINEAELPKFQKAGENPL